MGSEMCIRDRQAAMRMIAMCELLSECSKATARTLGPGVPVSRVRVAGVLATGFFWNFAHYPKKVAMIISSGISCLMSSWILGSNDQWTPGRL